MIKQQRLTRAMGAIVLLTGVVWAPIAAAFPFSPPANNVAPRTSTGGASRSGFGFTPPSDNAAPRQATGGASRSGFIPPSENAAPRQATGGASRSGFIPPSDNAAPQQATGGASRTGFMPPADNVAPQQAAGGASRNGFTPPTDNPAPLHTRSGASRTNLYGYLPSAPGTQAVSMLAVTPESFYGTTLAAHPTILVYLPPSDAPEAVFSLKDEAGNMVYQTLVPLAGEAGVVAIQLPADAPALEVGQNYQWYFALKLDGTLSPSSPYVDAWIKRIEVSPELAQALEQNTQIKQAEILAKNGIWYDSAATLATLRMAQPTDGTLATGWRMLLSSVGLEAVVATDSIGYID